MPFSYPLFFLSLLTYFGAFGEFFQGIALSKEAE